MNGEIGQQAAQGAQQGDQATVARLQKREPRPARFLVVCGLLSCLIYLVVGWLSRRFAYGTPGVERPIIEVLGLLAAAFAIYLVALRAAVRAGGRRGVVHVVVTFAVILRLSLLFSEPIQEFDIYRYLWDGQATIQGVSPFRYSPEAVLQSSSKQPLPPDLSRLVAVRDSAPAIETILSRVHFAELPTVYPPVSQVVFALAAVTTATNADVSTHLVAMKSWIVVFDLATIWLLIGILRFTSKPVGWSLAYAWCPLVLKEFANSGHLDSIAVCLTTLAVYLMLRACYRPADAKQELAQFEPASILCAIASSVALGLAVGAKLYAVVLAPLFICVAIRRLRWLRGTLVAILFLVVSGIACWPILHQRGHDSANPGEVASNVERSNPSLPPVPPGLPATDATGAVGVDEYDPSAGLKVFLSHWKMNDFLFLLVVENLTPMAEIPSDQHPWFVITTESWRQALTTQFADLLSIQRAQIPFVLARTATAVLFLMIAGCLCWRVVGTDEAGQFLEAVFLTLAWFWLLLPTQNPWYWIWAVPFLPFGRNRAWLALSGLTLLYYLRFWLGYHWADSPVPGTAYSGEPFFDFVVTWIEFGPWFVWLLIGAAFRSRNSTDAIQRLASPDEEVSATTRHDWQRKNRL